MGEALRDLRQPPDEFAALTRKELRALLVTGIARGNDPKLPSRCLHASSSMKAIRRLLGERPWLYSNWLVRWPKVTEGIQHFDFTNPYVAGYWLLN